MEGFREDQQKLVNDWLSAKKGSEEEKAKETEMREYLATSFKGGAEPDKVMDLMTGAKNAGLKVLCAEPNGAKLTHDGDGVNINHEKRDENWSNVVQRQLKNNPQSKVVLFAGSGHFTHSPDATVAVRLAQSGVKTADLTPPSQYPDGEIILPGICSK
jgi:uncharacterized iron-regulated protein